MTTKDKTVHNWLDAAWLAEQLAMNEEGNREATLCVAPTATSSVDPGAFAYLPAKAVVP